MKRRCCSGTWAEQNMFLAAWEHKQLLKANWRRKRDVFFSKSTVLFLRAILYNTLYIWDAFNLTQYWLHLGELVFHSERKSAKNTRTQTKADNTSAYFQLILFHARSEIYTLDKCLHMLTGQLPQSYDWYQLSCNTYERCQICHLFLWQQNWWSTYAIIPSSRYLQSFHNFSGNLAFVHVKDFALVKERTTTLFTFTFAL